VPSRRCERERAGVCVCVLCAGAQMQRACVLNSSSAGSRARGRRRRELRAPLVAKGLAHGLGSAH
jgi:hypothetical protein